MTSRLAGRISSAAHKSRAVRPACRVFLEWQGREPFFLPGVRGGAFSSQFCNSVRSVAMPILIVSMLAADLKQPGPGHSVLHQTQVAFARCTQCGRWG
jgi:hypothetical protein